MSVKIKMVPAICTRCGGAVEVDPSEERGVSDCRDSVWSLEKHK